MSIRNDKYKMKKVLIIAYYWPPSGGSGVQRWLKFVKFLPNFNWKPVVVVPKDPEYNILDPSLEEDIPIEAEIIKLPIWEPYWIFKKITGKKKEERLDTELLFIENKQTLIEKISLWIRGNLLIPDPRIFWINSTVRRLKKIIQEQKPKVIITTGPPHSVHLIGYQLKKHTNVQWIADLRDPWSELDLLDNFYPSKLAIKRQKRIEKKVLSFADKIITVSFSWAKNLEDSLNRKVEVITNGYDYSDIKTNRKNKKNKFIICHAGIINSFRNQNVFWESLNELCNEKVLFKEQLQINLIGSYNTELESHINTYDNLKSKLHFSGYVPHSKLKYNFGEAKCLLLFQNRSKNVTGHIPGKLFEYLAAQKPVVAIACPKSDLSKILKNCRAGYVCDFDDKAEMKRALLEIFNNESEQPDLKEIDVFSRDNLTRKLVTIIEDLSIDKV